LGSKSGKFRALGSGPNRSLNSQSGFYQLWKKCDFIDPDLELNAVFTVGLVSMPRVQWRGSQPQKAKGNIFGIFICIKNTVKCMKTGKYLKRPPKIMKICGEPLFNMKVRTGKFHNF